MVAAVDESVGALLGKLDELKIANDTVVIFFSDNGGLSTLRGPGPGCNLPLRAGKGWLYEGGVREPTIVRAPGVTKPGSVSDEPVVSMDFFPTMLELADLPQRPKLHADGRSIVPELKGGAGESRPLFWHYPHYHGSTWKPGSSIRRRRLEADRLLPLRHGRAVQFGQGSLGGKRSLQSQSKQDQGIAEQVAGLAKKNEGKDARAQSELRSEGTRKKA